MLLKPPPARRITKRAKSRSAAVWKAVTAEAYWNRTFADIGCAAARSSESGGEVGLASATQYLASSKRR